MSFRVGTFRLTDETFSIPPEITFNTSVVVRTIHGSTLPTVYPECRWSSVSGSPTAADISAGNKTLNIPGADQTNLIRESVELYRDGVEMTSSIFTYVGFAYAITLNANDTTDTVYELRYAIGAAQTIGLATGTNFTALNPLDVMVVPSGTNVTVTSGNSTW